MVPDSSALSSTSRIVKPSDAEEKEIRAEIKKLSKATVFESDRAPQFEDEYDYHFMQNKSQVREQLRTGSYGFQGFLTLFLWIRFCASIFPKINLLLSTLIDKNLTIVLNQKVLYKFDSKV